MARDVQDRRYPATFINGYQTRSASTSANAGAPVCAMYKLEVNSGKWSQKHITRGAETHNQRAETHSHGAETHNHGAETHNHGGLKLITMGAGETYNQGAETYNQGAETHNHGRLKLITRGALFISSK